ncbi:MAG: L,D-transpeptidase family protein [Planctomycetota bacterium]
MRWFWTLLILGILGYSGYSYWQGRSTSLDDSGGAEAAQGGGGARPLTPSLSEEPQLREEIQGRKSPEGDGARYRLALRLLGQESKASREEGRQLLDEIVAGQGELAPKAAATLFLESGDTGERLGAARVVVAFGSASPAYAQSSLELGQAGLAHSEDSLQVQAWEYLSTAYFARLDPEWRAAIRPDLQALVERLVFSPRMSRACTQYTVRSGDNLARIAREFGTTVEIIKWINRLDSDLIHSGTRLKILTGAITIEVDKSDFRLDARFDEKFLFSARVGIGEYGKTPEGAFVIDTRQERPDWQRIGHPVVRYGKPENPLGERWLGFKDTPEYRGYGIHGTDKPDTIGVESSNGCIRMRNEDVVVLYRLVPKGTRVFIRE